MVYNVSVLDFQGRECEVRIYEKPIQSGGMRCDENGVKIERKGKWLEDAWCPFVDGFPEEKIVDGMVRVHDIEEVERKAQDSVRSSLGRTKSKVYQLARGHSWEWFITFTFSPGKCVRYEWDETAGRLSEWLSYQRKRHAGGGYDLKYMVVPEQHKDGAWHFHGIFAGCSNRVLGLQPSAVSGVWNANAWRWGFSTATPVKDELAVSNYITKYITKDMVSVSKGKKRYWASRNLTPPAKVNFSVRATSAAGIRSPIQDALGDMLSRSSTIEGPNGAVTYLQVAGGPEEIYNALADAAVQVEEIEVSQEANQ